MCPNSCNVTAIVETVAGVKMVRRIGPGAPDTPQSQGGVCLKAQAGVQLLYDPDRLKTPVRKRTDGSWETLEWPVALTAAAAGLNKIRTDYGAIDNSNGGSSLVQFLFRRMGGGGAFYTQFMNEYGSLNQVGAPPICDGAKVVGFWLGLGFGRLMRDQANSTYTLLVGRSEFEAPRFRLAACREIVEMQKADGKLAVIDPRYTYSASKANLWLGIRPGTDLQLLLTLCRIILDHSLTEDARVPGAAIVWETDPWADRLFIETHAANLGLLRDELYKDATTYTAANAATVCAVPAADITALATEFAGRDTTGGERRTGHRPVADTTSGLARWSHAEDTCWALLSLNALMGSIGTIGGLTRIFEAALGSWTFGTPALPPAGPLRLHQQAGWRHTQPDSFRHSKRPARCPP